MGNTRPVTRSLYLFYYYYYYYCCWQTITTVDTTADSNEWEPTARSVLAISLRTVFSYSYIRLSVLHFLQLMLYVLARSVRLFEEAILFLCLHKRTIFVKYYKPTTYPLPFTRLEQLPTAASRNTLNEARRSLEMSMRRCLPALPTLAQPPHLWSSSPPSCSPTSW